MRTKSEQDFVICPRDWSELVTEQGWKGNVIAYDENHGPPLEPVMETLASIVTKLGLEKKKIGLQVEDSATVHGASATEVARLTVGIL